MSLKHLLSGFVFFLLIVFISCSKKDATIPTDPFSEVKAAFGSNIDPDNLANYAAQGKPFYITKDNSGTNPVTNAKATLGRVLFYDKNLSFNKTVSCGSCHKQAFAFSDTLNASAGVDGGITGRHSMRLINTRFGNELRFFWDERAATLEAQTTMPVKDHAEMGFSGLNGRPGISDLLIRLSQIGYYKELFHFVYGDITITEQRLQECLAQFIRSIQSFDSRFDQGRAQAANDGQPFANFSQQENAGKQLFLGPPNFDLNGVRISGGAGCAGCHNAPEFDIVPNTRNNGIIGVIAGVGIDINVTRSPTLRDVVNQAGVPNGPMMHTGSFQGLQNVVNHYNAIIQAPNNTNLDQRLTPNGHAQRLNLSPIEMNNLIAFMRTLSGVNVYTDSKWSDPFQ